MVKEYAMWVEEQPNGKFKFRQNYIDPLKSTPDHIVLKKVSVTLTKNTRQAQNKARQLLQEKINKKLKILKSDNSHITIEELFSKYLKRIADEDKPYGTQILAERSCRFFKKEFGADTIASNITTPMLNTYFHNLLYTGGKDGKGYANETVKGRKCFPALAYSLGVSQGLLKNNPFADLKIDWKDEFVKKKKRMEDKFLTDDEYQLILANCVKTRSGHPPAPDIRDLLVWMYETGMRIGEAVALQVSDIIVKDGKYYAQVTGTIEVHSENGHVVLKKSAKPKSESSWREIYLPKKAVDIYKKYSNHSDFLFINQRTNKPFNPTMVDQYLKHIGERNDMHKKISSHIFRHTHVSKLAEKGVPIELITRRVGHSNSKITKEIYLHVTQKMQNEFENEIEDL